MDQINNVYFDREAKEYVLVTNRICTLDHSSRETFAASHAKGLASCQMEPHEGIVLRLFVDAKTGFVSIAWTYRSINWAQMDHEPDDAAKATFEYVLSRRPSKHWIGRV